MVYKQIAESFVFMGEEALSLRYKPMAGSIKAVRDRARDDLADTVRYEEDKDYVVDYEAGTIRRTADSRILDGRQHPMYGVRKFNHAEYPDYSNRSYTVYLDYLTDSEDAEGVQVTADDIQRSGLLNRITRKLAAGEEALYVVYGDSISTGGEASEDGLAYYSRFVAMLEGLYPKGRIRIVNRAIGGEATDGGAARVNTDVVPLQPDLVTIGYGMNDQNFYEKDGVYGTSLEQFDHYLRVMIDAIRESGDTDIVLVTPCEPNPNWQHSGGKVPLYADVIRRLGQEYRIGIADAHAEWTAELAAGKTAESLLLNNINHPNDYGHWIYSKAFPRMLKR